jgi:hypothetical protein
MTYLMHVRQGKSTDWVKNVEAKGFMWCTPGKYLRKSMLQVLAKEVSHHYLPVSFYHQQAFPEKDRPADEEEFMAMSLKTKVVKAMDPSEKAAEDLEDMDI